MFRNLSNQGHLSDGHSSSSGGHGVPLPALVGQENSWIRLLYRPMSLLQRILPGRDQSRSLKASFVKEESEFLSQLEDMQLGASHLSYLPCEHDADAGLLEPRSGGALPFLSADSLREIGLQSEAEVDLSLCPQTHFGYLSSVRTGLCHLLLSSQEVKTPRVQVWGSSARRSWWGSLWGGEESSQRGLSSDVFWAEEGALAGQLCPQQTPHGMLGETTGPIDHKKEPQNNGGLHAFHNAEGSTPDPQLSNSGSSSEASAVTPEQDNGYSSLEEEHLCAVKAPREVLMLEDAKTPKRTDMEGETSQEAPEEEVEEEVLAVPQCQNKTINYIMGGPCSEDEYSQSEQESTDDDDDDDDDDGFDSEGSSELSDSTDDEDEDSKVDSEAERLWSSLCQIKDPYNPQTFSAPLHTGATVPHSIPTPLSSTHSTPSSSPPSSSDIWDDSASGSEVDEESLRLLNSFNSFSDFNLLNFQAPIRTQESTEASPIAKARTKKPSSHHSPAAPPEYRKEEAEERLDSGFCDTSTIRSCSSTKKVRFCDDVEEFFTSCGEEEEDRRGPWEELARDRCRFLRRCQEVEQSIAYCLQPQHRRRVLEQLAERR